jgi:hypothetical protein
MARSASRPSASKASPMDAAIATQSAFAGGRFHTTYGRSAEPADGGMANIISCLAAASMTAMSAFVSSPTMIR